MNPGDKFNIIIAGAGQVKQLSQKWISYSDISVDSLFDSFIASTYGDSVAKFRKPVITYCDNVASEFWSFLIFQITRFQRHILLYPTRCHISPLLMLLRVTTKVLSLPFHSPRSIRRYLLWIHYLQRAAVLSVTLTNLCWQRTYCNTLHSILELFRIQ